MKILLNYIVWFIFFLNSLLMTTQLIDITARNFDKISYKDYIALSNKRHDNYCSIYCDKYGCTHKSYLKSYKNYLLKIS
jgi:hypothetical protein